MLIATAGHIDHGKTSLIRALTGAETDRLPEEKARGISIDLGFAYWRPDDGAMIGFVDVPGHERYVRNMLAGLSGIGFALLVIAADDGIMPQTVEHLRMLDLLGVSRGIVALTKVDRVKPERVTEVSSEVTELLASSALVGAPVLPVSSTTGAGIRELAAALLGQREALGEDCDNHFRMAIDRAFTVAGSGTVVTGTVLSGGLSAGDSLVVSPLGKSVRLRGLQSGGLATESVVPGQRCALNLTGIEVSEIHRGDWLVAPPAHAPTQRIEALVRLIDDRSAPLRHGSGVHLHIGTADIGAKLLVPGQRTLQPGSEALVQIALESPTLAVTGDRFILRDASDRDLLGGGVVLDPLASGRRRSAAERSARAAALALPIPAARLAALAAISGCEPDLDWFARICNLTEQALAAIVCEGNFVRAGKSRVLIIDKQRFSEIGEALESALRRHHQDKPSEGGLSRRAARSSLGEPVSADLFATILAVLSASSRIVADGPLLHLPGHSAGFSAAETAFWKQVCEQMEDTPPRPLAVEELARQLRSSTATVMAMFARRKANGDLWQVTENRFMLRDHVADLVALAARLESLSPNGFTAAQFRDASGIGRNFVIQLLEFFDRIGVTRRSGDGRRMRGDWEAVTGPARLTSQT